MVPADAYEAPYWKISREHRRHKLALLEWTVGYVKKWGFSKRGTYLEEAYMTDSIAERIIRGEIVESSNAVAQPPL